jgi:hypothetical protein
VRDGLIMGRRIRRSNRRGIINGDDPSIARRHTHAARTGMRDGVARVGVPDELV